MFNAYLDHVPIPSLNIYMYINVLCAELQLSGDLPLATREHATIVCDREGP
jgi:hypothetical protein